MKKAVEDENKDRLNTKLAELTDDWTGGTHIYIPIFGQLVTVCVGGKEDAARLVGIEDQGDIELVSKLMSCPDGAPGMTVLSTSRSLVLLRKFWVNGDDSVLYHECLHVASGVLRRCNMSAGDNEELLAWLQQYIVKAIKWRLSCGNFVTFTDGDGSGPIEKAAMSNMVYIE